MNVIPCKIYRIFLFENFCGHHIPFYILCAKVVHLIMKTISNTRVNVERDVEERPYIGIYLPTPTFSALKNIEHIVL